MADIYADMVLASEWLQVHPEYEKKADTTLFYELVFKKYGYTFRDYDFSLSHYIKDPLGFSKILDKSSERLEARSKEYEEMYKRVQAWNRYLNSHKYRLDSLNQVKLFYDKGRNGLRSDKKPKAGELTWDKSAPHRR